jgi:hypothetical protein
VSGLGKAQMRIESIIWLRDIVDKLFAKHRVEPYEVEAVFDNQPKICFVEKGERQDMARKERKLYGRK